MAEKLKSYEEFAGTTEKTPQKMQEYIEYLKKNMPVFEPKERNDIWPNPKKV